MQPNQVGGVCHANNSELRQVSIFPPSFPEQQRGCERSQLVYVGRSFPDTVIAKFVRETLSIF